MPLIRDALLANDVLVTSWSTYHSHQLTDRLLQSTMESLKSRARGKTTECNHLCKNNPTNQLFC